jgi:hypothetical protein
MTQYRSKQILSRSSRLFKSVDIRCSNQFQADPTVYEVGKVTDSTNNHIDQVGNDPHIVQSTTAPMRKYKYGLLPRCAHGQAASPLVSSLTDGLADCHATDIAMCKGRATGLNPECKASYSYSLSLRQSSLLYRSLSLYCSATDTCCRSSNDEEGEVHDLCQVLEFLREGPETGLAVIS